MRRSTIFIVVIGGLAILTGCVWCLEHERRDKDREASMDASLRLLAKFHIEYIKNNKISIDDYNNNLESYANSNKDFAELKKYVDYSKIKNK